MKALLGLIPSLASDEIEIRVGRMKRRLVSLALIACCAVIAIGFAIAALEIWLAARVGPLNACLIIAAGFIVLALIILIAMKMSEARARRIQRMRREAHRAMYMAAAAAAAPAMSSKSILTVGIPLAALAGFLLAGRAGRSSGDD